MCFLWRRKKTRGHSGKRIRGNITKEVPGPALITDPLNTPQVRSASNPEGTDYIGTDTRSATRTNREYMEAEVGARLLADVGGVVDQAQPRTPAQFDRAQGLVNTVITKVAAWRRGMSVPGEHDEAYLVAAYRLFLEARPWIDGDQFSSEPAMYPCISAFICMVAQFVKHDAKQKPKDSMHALVLPFVETNSVPLSSTDANKIDIGLVLCDSRADAEPQAGLDYADIFAIFAVKRVGAKDSAKSQKTKANVQSFDYSRQLYASQIDRRFLWGLTCVDTKVFAIIFSNYRAHESPAMDVTTDGGCKELIRLLVGWSLCPWRQLGYDETVWWDEERQCHVIQVPSVNVAGSYITYYSDKIVGQADCLFGRHCRCFLATSQKPSKKRPEGTMIEPSVIVKDSWMAHSVTDDNEAPEKGKPSTLRRLQGNVSAGEQQVAGWPATSLSSVSVDDLRSFRSEHIILKKLNDELANNAAVAGLYPTIQHGGWVYQPLDKAEWECRFRFGKVRPAIDIVRKSQVLDSTRDILGQLDREKLASTSFCVHTRIAITPIADSLSTLESVDELIPVLYDVALQCVEMLRTCGIIHRDISHNNVMVVRDKKGRQRPRGILIDYDCARDVLADSHTTRPERTGTFPYMSVANLQRLCVERTILDDFESLFYLICTSGTFGPKMERRDGEKLPISDWYRADADYVAQQKRYHMDSAKTLRSKILRKFKKELVVPREGSIQGPLETLANKLHHCLTRNSRWSDEHDTDLYHGAAEDWDDSDPFIHRARYERAFWLKVHNRQNDEEDPPVIKPEHTRAISEDFLRIMEEAADACSP